MNRETVFLERIYGKVLDVGCVQGKLHNILASKQNIELHGMDLEDGNRITNFKRGSIEFAPYDDCSFDCVVLGELIEHVLHYRKALLECNRILKEDGLLLLSTPNKDGWANKLFGAYENKRAKAKKKDWQHFPHQKIFRIADLTAEIRNTGFDIESTYTFAYNSISISKSRYNVPPLLRFVITAMLPRQFGEQIVIIARKRERK